MNKHQYVYVQGDLSKENKKKIEKEILKINTEGWPKLFEPTTAECPCCSASLGPPVRHQGAFSIFIIAIFLLGLFFIILPFVLVH